MFSFFRKKEVADAPSDPQAEIEKLRQTLITLDERHQQLNATTAIFEECTGNFLEMARLETTMKAIRARIEELSRLAESSGS